MLVRHDAALVARHGEERDRLAALQAESRAALAERERADAELTRVAARLEAERAGKGTILARVREDRTTERRLLLELEQAAQALEETIRTLGARSARESSGVAGSGFAGRQGRLRRRSRPWSRRRFGRVVDPEFRPRRCATASTSPPRPAHPSRPSPPASCALPAGSAATAGS
ncbi:MAG: hypothetical protein R3E53_19420 [Myxococcota bacterium]